MAPCGLKKSIKKLLFYKLLLFSLLLYVSGISLTVTLVYFWKQYKQEIKLKPNYTKASIKKQENKRLDKPFFG